MFSVYAVNTGRLGCELSFLADIRLSVITLLSSISHLFTLWCH